MAKILDLNALEQPVLEIKLRDEKQTTFRLTAPTTKLVEKFSSAKDEISAIAKSRNEDKIKKVYELTAELISCNLDYVTVTAEELRDVYRLTFGDIVAVFAAYLEFINEFTKKGTGDEQYLYNDAFGIERDLRKAHIFMSFPGATSVFTPSFMFITTISPGPSSL